MARISAAQFIALLESGQADAPFGDEGERSKLRIPTGPWDSVDLDNPRDLKLEVADSVDLRGRRLTRPIFVYGVRFRGRVDMRDLRMEGGADLTACIFEEELLLDDAEVSGALCLSRISTARLSLNGMIVHGRLDMGGCQSSSPITMTDAEVAGFVDLRGIDCMAVELQGAHVRGDLRIGCASDDSGGSSPSTLQRLDARGCTIQGGVSIDGAGQGQPRCVATLRSSADAAQVEESFCWPEQLAPGLKGLSVDLSAAVVRGSVQVMAHHGQLSHVDHVQARHYSQVEPSTEVVWPVLERLNLWGARIEGNLALLGVLVLGGIDARNVHVGGELRLMPGELWVYKAGQDEQDWCCRQTDVRSHVNLHAARIDGQFWLHCTRVRDWFDLSSASIGSRVFFEAQQVRTSPRSGCRVVKPAVIEGDLQLYLSRFNSAVEFSGLHVHGNVNCANAESSSFIRLQPFLNVPTRVEGNIDLHSVKLRQFELMGAIVRGRVRLDGCEMFQFMARPERLSLPGPQPANDREHGEPPSAWSVEDAIVLSEVGQLRMRRGKITGDMSMEYLQVTGREVDGLCGLVIEDSEIGGNLRLFGEPAILSPYLKDGLSYAEARQRSPIDYRNFSAAIVGGIHVKRSSIGAEAHLCSVKVEGTIDLEDSRIGGDLRLEAVIRDVVVAGVPLPLARPWNPAVCEAMNLRMAKFMNDVSFTGLVVAGGDDTARIGIHAQYLTVAGDLKCFDEVGGHRTFAYIDDRLDLSYSEMKHLLVAGCMFGNPANDDPGPRGLILERAKVDKLEVRETDAADWACAPGQACVESLAYPKPICLNDVAVEVWEVEGTAQRGNYPGNKYSNLLANDRSFRRSTYRSLENSLRSSGDDDDADALYRAMRRRDWRERRSQLRRQFTVAGFRHPRVALRSAFALVGRFLMHSAFSVFLRHGTSPALLFGVVLILLGFSLPAYRMPANFEASLAFLAVPTNRFDAEKDALHYNAGPSAKLWGFADALQFALKNNVPIVPLQVRDDWQPRDQDATVWSVNPKDAAASCMPGSERAVGTLCIPWAPEDVFNLIQLINWICWPLLLTFYVRRLVRQ